MKIFMMRFIVFIIKNYIKVFVSLINFHTKLLNSEASHGNNLGDIY